MKKYLAAVLLPFLSVFTAFFAVAEESKPRPIKIGAVLGLTGPATVWANSVRDGIALAAEEASKDSSKPRVQLIVEDSKTDPKSSVLAYRKLVDVDGVDVVIGDVWDFITAPLVPLANQGKKLLISPTVVDTSIEARSPYFFTLGGQIRLARKAIDQFFEKNPEIRSAGIIYWNDPWGKSYLEEWKSSAAAHHVTITSEIGLLDWTADYKSEVARTLSKNPDALLAPHNMDRVVRRVKELKGRQKILTTSNVLEVLASGALPYDLADGLFFTEWAPTQEFLDRFKAKFGHLPVVEAQNGYDAFRAAYQAALASPDDPQKALVKLSFQGISGPIDFSKGMSANFTTATLRKVKDGKIIDVP